MFRQHAKIFDATQLYAIIVYCRIKFEINGSVGFLPALVVYQGTSICIFYIDR